MALSEERKEKRKKLLEKKKAKWDRTKTAKKLRRREAIRKQRKYDEEIDADVQRNQPKVKPIRNEEIRAKKLDAKARLEENLKILKALEEEYKKELASKKERNEDLEAQGYTTMQDKMEAINKQAIEDLRRLEGGRQSGDYGEFEDTLMKNWELEKEAQEVLSTENASDMLKDAQKSTANTISDLFGGSASCVAKDKSGNVLHTSGLDARKSRSQKPKGVPKRSRQKKS